MPKLLRYLNGESSRRRNERELRLGYFSHVFADYHRFTSAQRAALLADLPAGLRKVVQAVEDTGEVTDPEQGQLDWGDIATLEDKILALQDDATVRRRTWQTRARYALLVGAEGYQSYLGSRPPDETDATVPVDALRADLRRLLGSTHFSYSLAFVRENNRRRIMWKVMWWTVAFCAVSLAAAWSLVDSPDPRVAGTLFLVTLFGCLGAYISVQRRLQDTPDRGDPVIQILGLHQFNSIQPFPLIAGGVFAIVLYFILGAQFMQGDLFPALQDSGVPGTMQDWSKLFIWSLLAGFAERLVPDTLDRLTNQAHARGDASPIAVPPTGTSRVQPGGDGKDGAGAAPQRDADQKVVDAALKEAATVAATEGAKHANSAAAVDAPVNDEAAERRTAEADSRVKP